MWPLLSLLIFCFGIAGASPMDLESAVSKVLKSNLLFTVAGLKPITLLDEPEIEGTALQKVIGALDSGDLRNPELRFSAGLLSEVRTSRGYSLDGDKRIVAVHEVTSYPNRSVRVMNTSALRRRLDDPEVRALLANDGFGAALTTDELVEIIWMNHERSCVLAGIGFGFPTEDIRSFCDETKCHEGLRTRVHEVGEIFEPIEYPHFRSDRASAGFRTHFEGWEAYSATTYGDQSLSAWNEIRRRAHNIERYRRYLLRRGQTQVFLFNQWPSACATYLSP